MTATVQPESKSPSRRVVLAGALGGIGAWAASAIGRADPVRAGVDGDVILGSPNTATTPTKISNSSNANIVIWGSSTSGIGVYGNSDQYIAVEGENGAANQPAVAGISFGNSTGVQGYSYSGAPLTPKAKTGVYGYAAQDNTSNGVFGESPAGRAIAGYSSSGYAGYFSGRVFTSRWMEFAEVTTPASPSANRARLFVRDNGGKTQLAVKFPNGTVRVLATEA